jgi:carbamate kinase
VDKDLTAACIATDLHADRLLVLTDVSAVMRDFGTPMASPLTRVTLAEVAGIHFPAGSMGPKIEACRRFTAVTGHPSVIGALDAAAVLLTGAAGTTVVATPEP